MRTGAILLAAVALLAAACGGRPAPPPPHPVVLWESGPAEIEFPLPPGARWVPDYQRLRCKLELRSGTKSRWTCFAGGSFQSVLHFYAGRFGIGADAVTIERRPIAEVFSLVRATAAGLGHTVPGGAGYTGSVRSARLGPAGRLPMVLLESPFLDLETGRVENGTLISMRWRPREATP